jgi:predicted PurR-regulated permease PerM
MADVNSNLAHKPDGLWKDSLGRTGIRSGQLLLVIALISVVVFALTRVSLVVTPVLIALILAAAIAPVVKWFTTKGVPALWATMLAFASIVTVVGGLLTGIVFAIKGEWPELVDHSSDSFSKLWDFLKNGPLPVDESMIADAQKFGTDFLTSSSFGSGALTGLGVASSFFAGLGIVIVSLFFFLKDGSQMWSFFLGFIPRDKKEKAVLAGDKVISVLGGYVRGTASIAAVDAIIIWITLAVLQVPLALPLAVLTFIGGFIPIVGATAANVFALLIALVSNGPVAAIIVLIVIVVSGQLEGNILQPILMGNALKIHGLTIILALTVGTILAGVVGAILSVPMVAAGWAVVKIWRGSESDETSEVAPSEVEPPATRTESVGRRIPRSDNTETRARRVAPDKSTPKTQSVKNRAPRHAR